MNIDPTTIATGFSQNEYKPIEPGMFDKIDNQLNRWTNFQTTAESLFSDALRNRIGDMVSNDDETADGTALPESLRMQSAYIDKIEQINGDSIQSQLDMLELSKSMHNISINTTVASNAISSAGSALIDSDGCSLDQAIEQKHAAHKVDLKHPRLGLCHVMLLAPSAMEKSYFKSLQTTHSVESIIELDALNKVRFFIYGSTFSVYMPTDKRVTAYSPLSQDGARKILLSKGFYSRNVSFSKLNDGALVHADPVAMAQLWTILPLSHRCAIDQFVQAKVVLESLHQLRAFTELLGCRLLARVDADAVRFGHSSGAGAMIELFQQVLDPGSGFLWYLDSDELVLLDDHEFIELTIDEGGLSEKAISQKLTAVGIYGNAFNILESRNKMTQLEADPFIAQALRKLYFVVKKEPRPTPMSVVIEYGD
ncbi:hypothetical protein GQR58_029185 [Nymphon striatum]|nr:hypothetical protein GQR58_029185 [Nymphon striatum]